MTISRLVPGVFPGAADADRDVERHRERHCAAHTFTDKSLDLLEFPGRNLEDEFVMDLQQHSGSQ